MLSPTFVPSWLVSGGCFSVYILYKVITFPTTTHMCNRSQHMHRLLNKYIMDHVLGRLRNNHFSPDATSNCFVKRPLSSPLPTTDPTRGYPQSLGQSPGLPDKAWWFPGTLMYGGDCPVFTLLTHTACDEQGDALRRACTWVGYTRFTMTKPLC